MLSKAGENWRQRLAGFPSAPSWTDPEEPRGRALVSVCCLTTSIGAGEPRGDLLPSSLLAPQILPLRDSAHMWHSTGVRKKENSPERLQKRTCEPQTVPRCCSAGSSGCSGCPLGAALTPKILPTCSRSPAAPIQGTRESRKTTTQNISGPPAASLLAGGFKKSQHGVCMPLQRLALSRGLCARFLDTRLCFSSHFPSVRLQQHQISLPGHPAAHQ